MAYDTTEAVAKFLSGFQMKITNRERDIVAPDYYVKYSLTLSKGGKDFSTTFVSDPRAFGEPTVTQVFSALADDALTLRKYSTDEFVDKLYAQGGKAICRPPCLRLLQEDEFVDAGRAVPLRLGNRRDFQHPDKAGGRGKHSGREGRIRACRAVRL